MEGKLFESLGLIESVSTHLVKTNTEQPQSANQAACSSPNQTAFQPIWKKKQ